MLYTQASALYPGVNMIRVAVIGARFIALASQAKANENVVIEGTLGVSEVAALSQ